jgi:hypothetical protein
MTQDQRKGAEADRYGRGCAASLAEKIGARKSGNGNQYRYENEQVVIKCARGRNRETGVSLHMMETLAAIFGAFEHPGARYRILRPSAKQFRDNMRIRSGGRPAGKEGLVKRSVFEREGIEVAVVRMQT